MFVEENRTYSWGDFYETTRNCDDYSDEQKEKFKVFQALDEAKTLQEIRDIVKPLTKNQINWLNSPCLDGIKYSMKSDRPIKKIVTQNKDKYSEACRYYLFKKLDKRMLLWASCSGLCNIVKAFIDFGANVNFFSNGIVCIEGDALTCACEKGHFETVELLVNKGANIHIYDEYPLRVACGYGRFDIVKLLLKNGANIHAKNDNSIIRAACNGHTETVKLLLENGADIHAGNESALYYAILNNEIDIVEYLLKNGARVSEKFILNIFEQNNFRLLELCLRYSSENVIKDAKDTINSQFHDKIETVKIFLGL